MFGRQARLTGKIIFQQFKPNVKVMKKIALLKSGFRLFVVTLLLCSTAFLQSCKDAMLEPEKVETSKSSPLQEGSVNLKDNRLLFSSGTFAEKYLSDLKKSQPDGVNPTYSADIKGFKSMQEKYDELMKYDIGEAIKDGTIENYKDVLEITTDEKGRKDFKIAVRNHLLASIISEKGLIQIGNDVYKIKNGNAYRTDEKNIQELYSLEKKSDKVSVVAFEVTSKSNKSAKVNGNIGEEKSKPYIAFGGAATRRFCTRIDIYRGGIFNSDTWYGEFSVRHQRDNWYGWGGLSAGPWSFNAGGSCTFIYSTTTIPNIVGWPTINSFPSQSEGLYYNQSASPLIGLSGAVTSVSARIFGSWNASGNDGKPYNDSYDRTGTW